MKSFGFLSLLFLVSFIAGCTSDDVVVEKKLPQVSDFDHKVISDWSNTFLEIERYSDGYRPGPAPRGLAYLGLAAYEACVSGMPEYKSLSGQWPGFHIPPADPEEEYNWPLVVNETYHYLLPLFFSKATQQQLAQVENMYNTNLNVYTKKSSQDVTDRSIARGRLVADIIWNWAKTDPVGHEHYLDPSQGYDWHEHFKKDGDWIPTQPGPDKPVGGIWGQARTFSLKAESEKLCPPPLPFSESSTSELYAQALETYTQNTPTLSYEKEWVAEYWSDDLLNLTFSPGCRWMAIATQVLDKEGSSLKDAIVLVAKMGMAMNDASIGCWYSKFYYNFERPVTYINRVIDPNWEPSLYNPLTNEHGITPPFPTYPSGHASMGSAAAEVLASTFGYNYEMSDKCHQYRTEFAGQPRSFPSFYAMTQENAWSRVPLGVHFRMDSEAGVNYGTQVGRKINSLPWKK